MDYKERYNDKPEKVKEILYLIIDNCDICDAYVPQLDLIAINYELMFNAIESIKTNGYESVDGYGRVIKNHAVQTFNNTQQTIIKLLNSFPTNPIVKAKIEKLATSEDEDSVLNEYL